MTKKQAIDNAIEESKIIIEYITKTLLKRNTHIALELSKSTRDTCNLNIYSKDILIKEINLNTSVKHNYILYDCLIDNILKDYLDNKIFTLSKMYSKRTKEYKFNGLDISTKNSSVNLNFLYVRGEWFKNKKDEYNELIDEFERTSNKIKEIK